MVDEILSRLQAIPVLTGGLNLQAGAVFCALLILAQIILIPVTPFAIFAGFAFGFWEGCGILILAKMLSALVNFALSRWVARGWAQKIAGKHLFMRNMNEALEEEGLKLAILLRLCPIPFSIANYGYGMTRLRLPAYALATLLTILVPSLAFGGLGASLREGLQTLQDGQSSRGPWQLPLAGLSVTASILVARRISKIAFKSIKERNVH